MGKLFILCALLFQALSPVYSQQTDTDVINPSMKYGKPTEEELKMTTYAPDTAATAVVLYTKTTPATTC